MKFKLLITLLLSGTVSLMASSLMVHDAYVRATPPGLPNSAAFMMFMNHSDKDLAVVSATSNIAKKVELHTHDVVDGEMRMYQVKQIDVKANGHVMLQPGGFHIMFLGLHKPLTEGDNVDLTLSLSNGETVDITAPVKKVASGMKMHGKHGHHGHH